MKRALPFLVLLGLAAFLNKTVRLDRPWTLGYDTVGAIYSTIARNFVREGVLDPPLVQKQHTGRPPPGVVVGAQSNHPPLVPLAVAAVFWLTGSDAPWAARLAVIPAALLSLFLLHGLTRRLGGRRLAAGAVLFMALAPAAAFYGAWVDPVGWWSIFWLLLCFRVALPWFQGDRPRPGAWRGPALAAGFALAMLAEWNAVFLLPVLGVEAVAGGGRRRWLPVVSLGVAAVLMALLFRAILPGAGESLAKLGKLARLSDWNGALVLKLVGYHVSLFGWPLLGLAAPSAVATLSRVLTKRITPLDRLVVALILFQAWYTLIYPVGVRVHDFCSLYLLPPLAILAARTVLAGYDRVRVRANRPWAAAAFGLILLLAWALHATHRGLEGWKRDDGTVRPIQLMVWAVRGAVRVDEVAVTVVPSEGLPSVGYLADRFILGGVTTVPALEALMQRPERPAAFVIANVEVPSYPELMAALGVAPRTESFGFRVYDLRGLQPGSFARVPGAARSGGLPAPTDVRASAEGKRVIVTWKPPPGSDRVSGYRIAFGTEPGIYPVMFDVFEPRFTYEIEAVGRVHLVVAALDRKNRLGRRSADASVELNAPVDYLPNFLAIGIAALLLSVGHAWFVTRRAAPGR